MGAWLGAVSELLGAVWAVLPDPLYSWIPCNYSGGNGSANTGYTAVHPLYRIYRCVQWIYRCVQWWYSRSDRCTAAVPDIPLYSRWEPLYRPWSRYIAYIRGIPCIYGDFPYVQWWDSALGIVCERSEPFRTHPRERCPTYRPRACARA